MSRTIHCPACGGPIEVRSRSIQVLVCTFCDQSITLTPEGAEAHGKSAALADLFTELGTGAAGRLEGRTFQVSGRVRFEWSQGYWDEWAIWFDDGTSGWLHEDEGELSVLEPVALQAPVDLALASVGARLPVNGQQVYVREKRTAKVFGGEGQLPRAMWPGMELAYVDGSVGDEHWMLEAMGGTVELFVGRTLDDDALEVFGS